MIFNLNLANTQIKNDINSNCNLKDNLKSKLQALGWSNAELNQIDAQLNSFATSVVHPNSDIATLDEPNKTIATEYNNQITNVQNIREEATTDKVKDLYSKKKELDDFKFPSETGKEVISFKEPKVSGKVTSPVNLKDAHYTLKQDYPFSYGFIDSNKNFIQVNTKEGSIDLAHHSGTRIKIDDSGNVTMHIVGSFKQVIDGDYTLKVKGNMDKIIGGNLSENIGGNRDNVVSGNDTNNAGGTHSTNASLITHN